MKPATHRMNAHGTDLHVRLLAVCKQAMREGRWQVADHLLLALEDLAEAEPSLGGAVEEAYLYLGRRRSGATRGSH